MYWDRSSLRMYRLRGTGVTVELARGALHSWGICLQGNQISLPYRSSSDAMKAADLWYKNDLLSTNKGE